MVACMSAKELCELPNIGPAMARTLLRLGVETPQHLEGKSAEQLYEQLTELDGRPADPCVLDTFVVVVEHANGGPARPWWHASRERKARRS
jgi:hypothetical protein